MKRCNLMQKAIVIGCSTIGAIGLSTTASWAAPLGTYTFEGSSTLAPSSVSSAVGLSNFSHSSGTGIFVQGNNSLNSYSANGWDSNSANSLQSFFEFKVKPQTAQLVTLSQIMFDQRRSETGPKNWILRSSLDGFAANLIDRITPLTDKWRTDTVMLSPQFENLTQAITFRLYGNDATGSSGTWRLDNVSIDGTVSPVAAAVPTPAAIPAIVGFGVSLWRKRRAIAP